MRTAKIAATAQLAFAPANGDHSVLPRDKPIVVEGEAAPGMSLTVTLGDTIAQAKADKDGNGELTADEYKSWLAANGGGKPKAGQG